MNYKSYKYTYYLSTKVRYLCLHVYLFGNHGKYNTICYKQMSENEYM